MWPIKLLRSDLRRRGERRGDALPVSLKEVVLNSEFPNTVFKLVLFKKNSTNGRKLGY
jgi:hypothetical protein